LHAVVKGNPGAQAGPGDEEPMKGGLAQGERRSKFGGKRAVIPPGKGQTAAEKETEFLMGKSLTVDMGECVGCDACVELCPRVFGRSPLGYIEVKEEKPQEDDCIREVINCCPTGCIRWEED